MSLAPDPPRELLIGDVEITHPAQAPELTGRRTGGSLARQRKRALSGSAVLGLESMH